MRTITNGSLVIEYLMYTAIVGIIMTTLLQYSVTVYHNVSSHYAKQRHLLDALVIHDALTKDLWQIRSAITRVDAETSYSFIWRGEHQDIGWALRSGTIMRIQGHYDYHKATWSAAHKTLLAQHVSALTIDPGNATHNTTLPIVCSVENTYKKMSWYVVPRVQKSEQLYAS